MTCVKCGKITKYSLKWDMDEAPIPTCKKDEEIVRQVVLLLWVGLEKEVKQFMKTWSQPIRCVYTGKKKRKKCITFDKKTK